MVGSVQYVSNGVSIDEWRAATARAGGEAVGASF
jgi:hypothetical protein